MTAWGWQFNITTLTPIVGATPMPRSRAVIVAHSKIRIDKISLSFLHLQVPERGRHDFVGISVVCRGRLGWTFPLCASCMLRVISPTRQVLFFSCLRPPPPWR